MNPIFRFSRNFDKNQVRRALKPEKARVDVPGGFLKVGDIPWTATVREVREELGVEIEVVEGPVLLGSHTYGPDGAYVLAIGFRPRIVSGEPNPTDDVAVIHWISAEKIDHTDFA